jgi:hypothetical protein
LPSLSIESEDSRDLGLGFADEDLLDDELDDIFLTFFFFAGFSGFSFFCFFNFYPDARVVGIEDEFRAEDADSDDEELDDES